MLSDSTIRRRVMADSAMRRMFMETLRTMPAGQRSVIEELLRTDSLAAGRASVKPPAPARKPRARTRTALRVQPPGVNVCDVSSHVPTSTSADGLGETFAVTELPEAGGPGPELPAPLAAALERIERLASIAELLDAT